MEVAAAPGVAGPICIPEQSAAFSDVEGGGLMWGKEREADHVRTLTYEAGT